MAQVAIAWSLSKDGVTAPIVGTTSLSNLKDIIGIYLIIRVSVDKFINKVNIEGVHVELTEEEIKYLEEPYQPQSIIGHT